MTFEMLVGLDVIDDGAYAEYRAAIAPILARHGGGFRYDFRVSETLKAEVQHSINRVFTIYFEDEPARDRFFADAEYVAAKKRWFEKAVRAAVIIAEYGRG
jgi:uncharacterized protein (DUF1330 family)